MIYIYIEREREKFDGVFEHTQRAIEETKKEYVHGEGGRDQSAAVHKLLTDPGR
jgi:hypothetical protein